MVFLNVPVIKTVAAAGETEIVHEGISEAVSGNRIQVTATVTDPAGLDVVRTYFKAAEGRNYNFVAMEDIGNNQFAGTLPAPAADAGSVEYLILVKNSDSMVVKTQTFQTTVVEGNLDGSESGDDPVQVYSELSQAPTEIAGFSDNITTDVVVSAAKFGVVAGVVSQVAAGGSAAGAGAVSAGTVTATSSTATAATASASAGTASAGTGTATATTTAAATGSGLGTVALAGLGVVALGGAAYAATSVSDAVDDYTTTTTTSTYALTCNTGYTSNQCIDFVYSSSYYSSCSSYSSSWTSGTCSTSGAVAKCDYGSYSIYDDYNWYFFSPFTASYMSSTGCSNGGTLTTY
jgi:hypothetical protein